MMMICIPGVLTGLSGSNYLLTTHTAAYWLTPGDSIQTSCIILTHVTLVEHVGTSLYVKGEPDECGTATSALQFTSKSEFLNLLPIRDVANRIIPDIIALMRVCNSCKPYLL